MATTNIASLTQATSTFAGRTQLKSVCHVAAPSRKRAVSVSAAAGGKKMFIPGAISPAYLDDTLAGDYGWDPLGFGADPVALNWFRQAELVHARWAMLGTAGVLVQEKLVPDVFWYEAALPENLPEFAQSENFNLGALFAFEFLLMHFVEVRRWQDYKKFGSVNQDPIFSSFAVPNEEMGYPGGVFDPLGFGGGNMKELQTKEIKNGRLAMISFAGFIIQAQALGQGPLACLQDHLADPFGSNITSNLGKCVLPESVVAAGVTIPTPCLWP